jgi:hypothetical protein
MGGVTLTSSEEEMPPVIQKAWCRVKVAGVRPTTDYFEFERVFNKSTRKIRAQNLSRIGTNGRSLSS